MPTDNDALLAAGTQSAISLGNAYATTNLNKRNRKFSLEMYERQKADNLEFWRIQNEYNSPSAQMERFKAAGLNPNLIYGQQNTAGPVSTADFKQPQQQAPQLDGISYIDALYNLEMKAAQTDNLRAQNDVIQQDAMLKRAMIENTEIGSERRRFDLDFESELRPYSAEARKEHYRLTKAQADMTIDQNVRQELANASSLREAQERIQNLVEARAQIKAQTANTVEDRKRIIAETARIQKQIDLMFKEGIIKDLDVELSRQNVRPTDPLYHRYLGVLLSPLLRYLDTPEGKGKTLNYLNPINRY